jgi:DNA ligase-associated metallophosphoesterase
LSESIEFFGLEIELLASRAAYVPQLEMLLVADLHLGKDATFRARGIPVPSGPSAHTLERLGSAVLATRCRTLVLLGDVFHGPESNADSEREAFSMFLASQPGVQLHLVLGNHDRWVHRENLPGDLHASLNIGGVDLIHDPAAAVGPSIAGHLHPGFRLSGRARASHLMPCFWQTGEVLVLPAFGEFTGLCHVDAAAGDRVFVVAGSKVCEVPGRTVSASDLRLRD